MCQGLYSQNQKTIHYGDTDTWNIFIAFTPPCGSDQSHIRLELYQWASGIPCILMQFVVNMFESEMIHYG